MLKQCFLEFNLDVYPKVFEYKLSVACYTASYAICILSSVAGDEKFLVYSRSGQNPLKPAQPNLQSLEFMFEIADPGTKSNYPCEAGGRSRI